MSFFGTCEMYITFLLGRFSACGSKVQKVGGRPTSKADSYQGEAEDCHTDKSAFLCLLLLWIKVSFDKIS